MCYIHKCTQQVLAEICCTGEIPNVIDDLVMGFDYLGLVLDGHMKENNIVLMVSLDGAQLYNHKDADCWLYIWRLVNLSPNKQYKKINVLPGGFIPGPNKPKNIDSFSMLAYITSLHFRMKGLGFGMQIRTLCFSLTCICYTP